MYVRVREDSRQGQSSYVFSPHSGSYLGELGQSQTLPERLRNAWNARGAFGNSYSPTETFL